MGGCPVLELEGKLELEQLLFLFWLKLDWVVLWTCSRVKTCARRRFKFQSGEL